MDGKEALTQTLLPQGHPLELLEAVLVSRAINDRVLQDIAIDAVVVDGGLARALAVVLYVLHLPRVAALVVDQARVVVALVEVLEHGGEDLGLLVRQVDALGVAAAAGRGGVQVLRRQRLLEPWRGAEDVLVRGEDTLVFADYKGYDGGG